MQKIQFFFAYLLLLLAGWPHFRLVVDLAISLTIDLAIGGVELTGGKDAVGFSE